MSPFALVIENDPALGCVMQKSLEFAGFDTALDVGGIHYVSTIVTRRPALIVLDLNLSEGVGEQAYEDIRNLYPAWALPLVLVTSDAFQAWDLRAQGETVLIKPIVIEQLEEIASHLKGKITGSIQ